MKCSIRVVCQSFGHQVSLSAGVTQSGCFSGLAALTVFDEHISYHEIHSENVHWCTTVCKQSIIINRALSQKSRTEWRLAARLNWSAQQRGLMNVAGTWKAKSKTAFTANAQKQKGTHKRKREGKTSTEIFLWHPNGMWNFRLWIFRRNSQKQVGSLP